jgi:hypothetical protein
MNKFFKSSLLFLIAAMAPSILALQPAELCAQTQNVPSPRRAPDDFQKDQINAWTVRLAGGLLLRVRPSASRSVGKPDGSFPARG